MKIREFPRIMFSPELFCWPFMVRINAPIIPKAMPVTFIVVIFSLRITEDKIRTIIGTVIIITDALMGVVNWSPLKKANIFNVTPNKAAVINFGKSLPSIFLVLIIESNNQNKIPAKNTLRIINPKGRIYPLSITSLAKVNVTP